MVTVAHERRDHLARQRRALRRHHPGVDHVIVDLGGPDIEAGPQDVIVRLPYHHSDDLPLARARNVGAAAVWADVLIFLDVDCIPSAGLLARYTRLVTCMQGIWCGPVGYLPPAIDIADWTDPGLREVSRVQAGRPQFGMELQRSERYDLFWSLSFALSRTDWRRIGGFDERFTGYGGEDTDFARSAQHCDIPLWFDGFASAFHQHHDVSSPPVEHLSAIVRNSRLYYDKWAMFAMQGWLNEFAALGLVDWDPAAGLLVELDPDPTARSASAVAAQQVREMAS